MKNLLTVFVAFSVVFACVSKYAGADDFGVESLEEAVRWSQIIADDDGVINEIKKRVACFQETNCTRCAKTKHCSWCTNGHLYSYAGDAKHTIQQGPMCWSGGFLHMNKTVVSFNIAGKEYGIKMDCRFWKMHSKKCGMSDFSWILVIIGAPIAVIVLIGSVFTYRNRARRAQYALAT